MTAWFRNSQAEKTSFGGLSRSELMSRIRSSGNSTTELRFISLMRLANITGWRRNYPLFGKPDFTFPKQRLVVFVDGCFWHGHNCGRNLVPKKNRKAWEEKIRGNRIRDIKKFRRLRKEGWHVVRIWECSLKSNPKVCLKRVQGLLSPLTCK